MSLELHALRKAVADHGRVTRIVVAEVKGSAPREPGAAMLVWPGGHAGTIGGGALEYEAARNGESQVAPTSVTRVPLGPALGQCCGGSVTLVSEVWDAARLASLDGPIAARPVDSDAPMPLTIRRLLARARDRGETPPPITLTGGWLAEPIATASRPLWIWGAGHVGRALVTTLAPLPDLAITWIDTAPDRFPEAPSNVTILPAADPAKLVSHAPPDAEHLIVTYSHALDLELCHRLLGHGFAFAGLIGSATKWARFRNRLRDLGHSPAQIDRITCPIGDPALGKHPQAIAIGVASAMLRPAATQHKERRA